MEIPNILLDRIAEGDAVLFLGAGASADQGFSSTADLSQHIESRFNVSQKISSLRDLAQFAEEATDRPALVAALRDFLDKHDVSPTAEYLRLLSLPWRAIITTNYDSMIENGLETIRRRCSRVLTDQDLPNTSRDAVMVLKLHGDANSPSSLIFTDEDYISFQNRKPLILQQVRSLFSTSTIVFIGYSFDDTNMREINSFVQDALKDGQKRHFLISPGASRVSRSRFDRMKLHYLDSTLSTFASRCAAISSQHQPQATTSTAFDEAAYLARTTEELRQLENVFTMLRVGRHRAPTSENSLINVATLDSWVQAKSANTSTSITFSDLLKPRGRWMISGAPGSGKSTLLKMLFLSAALESQKRPELPLPVFISLGRYQKNAMSGLQLVIDSLNSYLDQPIALADLEILLRAKSVLWFLDGLDEGMLAIRDKGAVWAEIANFIASRPQDAFVVSCRDSHLPRNHSLSSVFIEPFDQRGAIAFIKRYLLFFGSSQSADQVYSAIPEPARGIANTPLILSMMVSAFLSSGSIPGSLDELYRLLVSHVLENVEADRSTSLEAEQKDQLLAYLAFEMLVTGRTNIRVGQAREIVGRQLAEMRTKSSLLDCVNAEMAIGELVYSGLMVQRSSFLSFFHLTILEYFAACEMNREYSFVAQSDMDQYFLRNTTKIRKLLERARIKPSDRLVELGAGIGSVARHFPSVKELTLLDLDPGLVKILTYQFPRARILQADAIKALPGLKTDVLFSNLPFFLTDDILAILRKKKFRIGLMSVKEDYKFDRFSDMLEIKVVETLDEDDFFPRQPFKSKVIEIKPRPSLFRW